MMVPASLRLPLIPGLSLVGVVALGLWANISLWTQPSTITIDPLPVLNVTFEEPQDRQTLAASPLFQTAKSQQPEAHAASNRTPASASIRKPNIDLLGVVHAGGNDGVAVLKHQGKSFSYRTGEYLNTDSDIQLIEVSSSSATISKNGTRFTLDLIDNQPAKRQTNNFSQDNRSRYSQPQDRAYFSAQAQDD